MSTPDDLRSRVTEYQKQLAQIIALLLVSPGNEQLVKLKSDLEKAIAVTNQLIAQQQGGPVAAATALAPSASVASASGGEDVDHVDHGSDMSSDDEADGEEETDGRGHGRSSEQGIAPGAAPPTPAEVPLRVGENVEAVGGDRPYAGTVLALSRSTDESNSSTGPDTATVKYFEFEAPVMVSITMLQRIPRTSIRAGQLAPGFKCQVKFGQDQQWYDAVIESESEHGYMATFIGYGNTEEVPIEYIRSFGFGKSAEERKADMRRANASLGRGLGDADSGASTSGHGSSISSGTAGSGAGATAGSSASQGVRIPASLRILPTDTEEVGSCGNICTICVFESQLNMLILFRLFLS
jgi:hypothetical protein